MTTRERSCYAVALGCAAMILLSVFCATCTGCRRADNAYPNWSRRCRDGRPAMPQSVTAVWEDDVLFSEAIVAFKANRASRVWRMSEIREKAEACGMPAGCVPVLYYGKPNDSVWVNGYLVVSQSPYDPNSESRSPLLSRNPRKPRAK
jgi:hypothetical protein